MDRNEIRRLANELKIEYDGDLCELYAHVCNRIACRVEPDEEQKLLSLKREIEHQITLEVMEEYSWERDDMGVWHYIDSAEFSARFWASHKKNKESADGMDKHG